MHPIEAFIRNPVKVSVGVLIVALFGAIALLRMPMQLTPEVNVPTISIQTRWPGASPQEIEKEIVREQEEQLKGVEGVTKMTSESADSSGSITLEFRVGTDMEEALLKVNSRLQQVPEYPEDSDEPVIRTSSSSDRAIAWFILSARIATSEQIREFQASHPEFFDALQPVLTARNPGLAELRLRRAAEKHPEIAELLPVDIDVPKLRKFAEDMIEARFERVPGVSDSNVLGGRELELQVIVDPYRLAAHRLTIDDVRAALRSQNKDTSAGDLWEGKRRYVVRTLGQFRSAEQVAGQILAVRDGEPVYVHDVAEVRLGHKKPDGFVRRFGSYAIAVNCIRNSGANVLSVMAGLREENRILNEGLLKQRGLTLTQVYDETTYIYSAVGLVNQNIIVGGSLTVIVLMLFLHLGARTLMFIPLIAAAAVAAVVGSAWWFAVVLALVFVAGAWFARGALVISMAIPISIIGTFLVMHQMNRSLNVISLAGLAFAVGMLVDNAVVVLENIYRHHQLGLKPFAAAERGAREVWGAVVASTLTTLAVFVPVLFVEEVAGQLFRDIALAISAAVGLSLLVSVTVIPTAAARLLQDTTPDQSGRAVAGGLRSAARGVGGLVVGLNRWILKSYARRALVVLVLVGVTIGVSFYLRPKIEYLPTGNRNLIICIILPPPGYNLEQLNRMGQTVEDEFEPYWNVDPASAEAEKLDFPVIEDFFYVARGRSVFLGLRSADPSRVDELIDLVGKLRPKLAGTIVVASKSSLFGRGLTASRAIDIEVTGPELTTLVGLGGQILGKVGSVVSYQRKSPDGEVTTVAAQARPVPSLDLSSPEVHVEPKLMQSRDVGLSANELGYAVNALIDGAYASDFFIGGDKIDLTIMGLNESVGYTQDIEGLPVATPSGEVAPIGSLATVRLGSGPEQVNHRERQRAITIQVTPPPEIALEDAITSINEEIVDPIRASGQLGAEYTINLSGSADKLRETWLAMRWNLAIALMITYLLMAALFESWRYPLVIILSVPLGAVGGILGLRLLSAYLVARGQPPQTLDVLTMLGFVILIGTVVNNAILIVHQSLNYMRLDGMTPNESILESVRTRIRPIFMTTATTVLGLSPLVFFPGPGSELYRGLGAVVLGGLLMSTAFTLVLVPTLFSLAMELGDALSFSKRRGETAPEQG